MTSILLAAVLFGLTAWAGIAAARYVCAGIDPLPDGPRTGVVPERVLIGACAVLGAIAASRGLAFGGIAVIALACGLFVAIWAADVARGIVPDLFTLVPLGAVLLAAALAGRWEVVVAAVVSAIPFAILAWRSQGMGMGWGDVKLAALGGPLIGMQNALLAFAVGALAAVVIARVRGRAGEPIAFAPYLVSAIALPLAVLTPGMTG